MFIRTCSSLSSRCHRATLCCLHAGVLQAGHRALPAQRLGTGAAWGLRLPADTVQCRDGDVSEPAWVPPDTGLSSVTRHFSLTVTHVSRRHSLDLFLASAIVVVYCVSIQYSLIMLKCNTVNQQHRISCYRCVAVEYCAFYDAIVQQLLRLILK